MTATFAILRLFFNISLAWRAIRGNKLRSILTIFIIGLGIMALVGILTGIEVMKGAVSSSFSSLGANSFQLTSDIIKTKKGRGVHISVEEGKNITYAEALAFKKEFAFPASTGISVRATQVATVQYAGAKTNPNIAVMGIDENYLTNNHTALIAGRGFSTAELEGGAPVVIVGFAVAKDLFQGKPASALGKMLSIGSTKYMVAGVAEEKGSSFIMSADNSVYIPLANARSVYGGGNAYVLSVTLDDVNQKALAAEEAEGLFRRIRKLPLGTPANFSVSQNDELAAIVLDSIRYIRWAAVIIGLITLMGSVIGLTNIMLVSVAERTREIGISKALGARGSTVRGQFLTESVLISVLGGILGVILGILVGQCGGRGPEECICNPMALDGLWGGLVCAGRHYFWNLSGTEKLRVSTLL